MSVFAPRIFVKAWLAALVPTMLLFLGLVAGTAWLPYQDYLGSIPYRPDPTFQRYPWPFDRQILLHRIGASAANLQQADIVFLGQSRLWFGLDPKLIEEFSTRTGIRVYNLTIQGEPAGEFVLRVLEKHGSRARLFILNADVGNDKGFFDQRLTPPSREALETTWLRAYFALFIRTFPDRLRLRLNQVVPWLVSGLSSNLYMSTKDGTLLSADKPGAPQKPVAYRTGECNAGNRDLPLAHRYLERLHQVAPSASIVMTLVPSEWGCPERASRIARAVGVPFIEISPAGLTSFDGSHLDRSGARLFTARLLERLQALDAFKALAPRS
jgi:hypothetical protein